MPQYDFGTINTATTSGADLATLLQNWRDAVLSNHLGTVRPSYVRVGQIWINNSTPTNWAIYLWDGADDILLGFVNTTDNTANFLHRAEVTLKTASATIAITERNMTVGVSASTANLTITLLPCTTAKNGFKITIQKRDNTAFTITVARSGADLINGAASITLNQQYDTVELVSDGVSAWYAYGGVLDASITAAKLADNAVLTPKLADGAVTAAKLAAAVMALLVPSGSVMAYAGATAPANWLLCHGQLVSRTTYAALFAAIGTTYGAGDGSTTFALPDGRGRVLVGRDNMGGTAANRLASTRTVSVSTIAQSANEVTVVTNAAHGLDPGNSVTISGAGNAVFNGTWTVVRVLGSSSDYPNDPLAEGSRGSRTFTFTRGTSATISAVSGGTITTAIANGVDGATLGAVGGSHVHVLTEAQLASHRHRITTAFVTSNVASGSGDPEASNVTNITNSTGGDGPHNNVQPSIVMNYIIKT